MYTSRYEINTFPYERTLQLWTKKCQRRGLGNVSNKEISNLGSSASTGTGSIDVEAKDQYKDDAGMPTRENMKHDGLLELDVEALEDSNDEMIGKV